MTERRSITLHNERHGTKLEVLETGDSLAVCVHAKDGSSFDAGFNGIAFFLESAQVKELKDFLRGPYAEPPRVCLPAEPTREIINAMERAFHGENAINITGPDDRVGKWQWREWARVYAAILEAAR